MIEATKISDNKYEVKFTIAQQLSKKTGIPEKRCAELLADEFMKLLGLTK